MRDFDAIVIGAGIAGLSAAREMYARGASVRVLEARDRVGGRTAGHRLANGFTVEMGGQWVGRTQTEVLALVEELGLETFPTYDDGAALSVVQGSVVRYEDESFGLSEHGLADVSRLQEEIERLASTVDLSAPWSTPDASELDRQTFDTWLTANTDDEVALAFFRTIAAALFSAESYEMSLLHFLFYVRSGGSLDILAATTGGAQEMRIVGGSHRISERMAEQLGDDVVQLERPVHEIRQDDGGVNVRHAAGDEHAREVIVALPPTLAGRLRYDPPLPASRDLLTQQVPMGSVIKIQAAYDEPFWRRNGLSGQALGLEDEVSLTYDNSPPDGSIGVLAAFIEGARARDLAQRSPDARREVVLDRLAAYFGPRAREVTEYVERDWSAEPYTRGCYGGRLGAGVWTQYGKALVPAVGRIHWAGSESAEVWNGYMDGAVRSGRRAAGEVLSSLA